MDIDIDIDTHIHIDIDKLYYEKIWRWDNLAMFQATGTIQNDICKKKSSSKI